MPQRLIIFLLLLLSCGAPKEVETPGDDLVIGTPYQPSVINPLVTDSTISANLLDLLFDTLVEVDAKEEIRPLLAERWEISEDGLTWTFYLRKGILFHDGAELTAEDVKYTFETLSKIKNQGDYLFFNYVRAFSAPDRYVFRIQLSHYDQALWGGMYAVHIVPRYLLEKMVDPQKAPVNQKPIGTGPFRLVSQSDQEIILEANDRYFLGRPFLNRIKVKVFPSQRAGLTHLVSGQIDLLFFADTQDYNMLAQLPEIKIYRNWHPFLYLLCFNSRREIFHSPKIRQAINMAVDRQKIITSLPLQEKPKPATGPISPWDVHSLMKSSGDGYNPQEALRLFREEGWIYSDRENTLKKNGRPFEFVISSIEGEELNEKILNQIQVQLLAVGIKVKQEVLPMSQFMEGLYKQKKFDIALIRYVEYPFVFTYYSFWHSSQIETGVNFFSYVNPVVDSSLDQIRLSRDSQEQHEAALRFQQTLLEDPPAVFLFWRKPVIAIHRRFRGIPEDYMSTFREFRKVWVPKEEQTPHE